MTIPPPPLGRPAQLTLPGAHVSGQGVAAGLPVLLTAQPCGVKLAAKVRHLAVSWIQDNGGVSGTEQLAVGWAATLLLTHACESPKQAVQLCEQVQKGAATAIATAASIGCSGEEALLLQQHLVMMHAAATELLAQLLAAVQPERLAAAGEAALQWLAGREGPAAGWHAALRAAGVMLAAVRRQAGGATGPGVQVACRKLLDVGRLRVRGCARTCVCVCERVCVCVHVCVRVHVLGGGTLSACACEVGGEPGVCVCACACVRGGTWSVCVCV